MTGPSPWSYLGACQTEILWRLAREYTNSAIGRTSRLALKSVENYITVLYEERGIELHDPAVNPRVTATLIYLRETGATAQQPWHRRYRGEGAPFPCPFLLDEVAFRGALDSHVYPVGSGRPRASAWFRPGHIDGVFPIVRPVFRTYAGGWNGANGARGSPEMIT
ncbi:MAG: hypothetical protein HY660_00300 [Armatimonadetes bacterium]|nr:hypothetical protein [Armatimonadota bacterium]